MKMLEFLKKHQLKKEELKNINGGDELVGSSGNCPSGYVEVYCNFRFIGCFLSPTLHPPC